MPLRPLSSIVVLLIAFSCLFGCSGGVTVTPPVEPVPAAPAPRKTGPSYVPISEKKAEDLSGGLSFRPQGLESWEAMKPGLEDSLGYILNRPEESVCVSRPGLTLTWGQLGDSVAEMLALLPRLDSEPELVGERFQWLKVAPGTLLTGYYEPWLEASLTRQGPFQYPLYGVPDDLRVIDLGAFHSRWKGQSLVYRMSEKGIRPYHDREAIDGEGALHGEGKEIAWAKDPVDVFFLQIQGSGRLVLPDGRVKHILYGERNGRRYVSLGKVMIRKGYVPREEMSMQRIRQFLEANPEKAKELMFRNPSYVFFRLSDEGPYGAMGSILTPRLSVAVDRNTIPLGGVCVLKTALQDYEAGDGEDFLSLVLAQDTGGAIQGTRMDLFCGSGDKAERLAGHLQEDSEVFLLVSRRVMGPAQGKG